MQEIEIGQDCQMDIEPGYASPNSSFCYMVKKINHIKTSTNFGDHSAPFSPEDSPMKISKINSTAHSTSTQKLVPFGLRCTNQPSYRSVQEKKTKSFFSKMGQQSPKSKKVQSRITPRFNEISSSLIKSAKKKLFTSEDDSYKDSPFKRLDFSCIDEEGHEQENVKTPEKVHPRPHFGISQKKASRTKANDFKRRKINNIKQFKPVQEEPADFSPRKLNLNNFKNSVPNPFEIKKGDLTFEKDSHESSRKHSSNDLQTAESSSFMKVEKEITLMDDIEDEAELESSFNPSPMKMVKKAYSTIESKSKKTIYARWLNKEDIFEEKFSTGYSPQIVTQTSILRKASITEYQNPFILQDSNNSFDSFSNRTSTQNTPKLSSINSINSMTSMRPSDIITNTETLNFFNSQHSPSSILFKNMNSANLPTLSFFKSNTPNPNTTPNSNTNSNTNSNMNNNIPNTMNSNLNSNLNNNLNNNMNSNMNSNLNNIMNSNLNSNLNMNSNLNSNLNMNSNMNQITPPGSQLQTNFLSTTTPTNAHSTPYNNYASNNVCASFGSFGSFEKRSSMCYNADLSEQYLMCSGVMGFPSAQTPHSSTPQRSRFREDFKQIKQIGKGQFGYVLKCKHRLDGNIYAVKVTNEKFKGENDKYIALHEVFALSALSVCGENPYIVKYFTGWIENSHLYLVMEHCVHSLKKLIDTKVRLPEKQIRKIMRHICLGLKELHSKNIVHLDIKPENILISRSGKYKIGDLGLARIYNKCANVPEGDCRYLAVELLDDDEKVPDLRKADIFSLGAMTYQLMRGGNLPKNGEEWHNIRQKRVNMEGLEIYSDKLKDLVKRMLDPNPVERPTCQDLLSNHLLSGTEMKLKKKEQENALLQAKIRELEAQLHFEGAKKRQKSL